MPFFSPLWARGPRVVLLPPRARRDVAAWCCRAELARSARSSSDGGAAALPGHAGSSRCRSRPGARSSTIWASRAERVSVVPPGHRRPLHARRATSRSDAARRGRRAAQAGEALRPARSRARRRCSAATPDLEVVIVGEGYERAALEDRVAALGAGGWLAPGRPRRRRRARRPLPAGVGAGQRVGPRGLGHDAHRGGGLRHAGRGHPHRRPRDAVVDGESGLLADDAGASSRGASTAVLGDATLRDALGRRRARPRGRASPGRRRPRGTLDALADEARHRPTGARPTAASARPTRRASRPGSPASRRRIRRPASGRSARRRPAASAARRRRLRPAAAHRTGQGRRRHQALPLPRPRPAAGRGRLLWDPNVGLGTVTHQNIGYLLPMGPCYWVFDASASPTGWPSASGSARSCSRPAPACATCSRMPRRTAAAPPGGPPGRHRGRPRLHAQPYVLAYSAASRVILLPWAALPWLIGLLRARRGAAAGATRPCSPSWSRTVGGDQRHCARLRRPGRRCCGCLRDLGDRESPRSGGRSAPLLRIGVLTLVTPAVVDRRAAGPRAATASGPPATPRRYRPSPRRRRRPEVLRGPRLLVLLRHATGSAVDRAAAALHPARLAASLVSFCLPVLGPRWPRPSCAGATGPSSSSSSSSGSSSPSAPTPTTTRRPSAASSSGGRARRRPAWRSRNTRGPCPSWCSAWRVAARRRRRPPSAAGCPGRALLAGRPPCASCWSWSTCRRC